MNLPVFNGTSRYMWVIEDDILPLTIDIFVEGPTYRDLKPSMSCSVGAGTLLELSKIRLSCKLCPRETIFLFTEALKLISPADTTPGSTVNVRMSSDSMVRNALIIYVMPVSQLKE